MALAAEWLGGGEGKGGMGGRENQRPVRRLLEQSRQRWETVGETWDSFWRLIGTCFFVLFLLLLFLFLATPRENEGS